MRCPELAGLDREAAIALLDRAAGIGLLESLGGGYYRIHPALPWYFTTLFTTSYGPPGSPAAAARRPRLHPGHRRTRRLLPRARPEAGHAAQVVPVLGAEEANLRHALDLARAAGLWDAAAGCLQGLRVLYERTGRDGEWARLVAAVTPDFTDPATGGPLPGRDDQWSLITELPGAARAAGAGLARRHHPPNRPDRVGPGPGRRGAGRPRRQPHPGPAQPDPQPRRRPATSSGNILREQDDPGCLPHFQEALALAQRIGDRPEEAQLALQPRQRLPDWCPGCGTWTRPSTGTSTASACAPTATSSAAPAASAQLGQVALERFDDARAAGEAEPVLLEHLNAALGHYQQALDLIPADDHENRATIENQLGIIYHRAGDTGQALRHYQQAIQHDEARGDIYGAGQTRYNIALLLAGAGRVSDALLYARAALDNYQQAGPGAAADAAQAEQLIADLEQPSR